MILKYKDDVAPLLQELEQLLATPSLSKAQKAEIEEEIWRVRVGAKGEKEAAYHIDFDWKNRKNSVVLHDLRIEHGGRVAQIDHLIINRLLDIHVLESKGFGTEVRISAAGEWETKTRYGWKGMASPVEQNRRHINVLEAFLRDHQLQPKRLGIAMPFRFLNWVLVSPDCPLRRNGKDWDRVVKMDMFRKEYDRQIDQEGVLQVFASVSKFVSVETVDNIGRALLAAHQPATFNFAAKFGILPVLKTADDSRFTPPVPPPLPVRELLPTPQNRCEACTISLEAKVIDYCRSNPAKFGGRLLCRSCQKTKPPIETKSTKPSAACEVCTAELDSQVIAFCRFNSKRFGGRKLCRSCQTSAVTA